MATRRVQLWTVLAVGEGDAEVALLQHLKAIYVYRNCGCSVKIQPAHGKGAEHVIDTAVRLDQGRDYKRRMVLFDTDAGYTPKARALAEEHRLIQIPSTPCIEAMLLSFHGDDKERNSAECKAAFEERFGDRVQAANLLERFFDRNFLERVRQQDQLLHKLINTFGVPPGYPEDYED